MDSLLDFPEAYSPDLKLKERPSDEVLQDMCNIIQSRMNSLVSHEPKVSIIFPAYNEEIYLPLMLWTLSKLTTSTPIEIIGVNNASTDRTGEIIEQSGIQRIDEHRKGVSYARQAGLEASKGEFIATTDADTQIPPTWIQSSMKYFEQDGDLICFSGGVQYNEVHCSYYLARGIRDALRNILGRGLYSEKDALWSFPGANSFYRKDSVIQVGGYEKGSDLGEDNILASRLAKIGKRLRVYDDNEIIPLTSNRRMATILKVLKVSMNRLQDHWMSYSHVASGRKFQDIR